MKSKQNEQFVWRIRDSKGLFSTGGQPPWFRPNGKSWNKLQDLERHIYSPLGYWEKGDKVKFYKGCHVVKYKVVEIESSEIKPKKPKKPKKLKK